MKIFFKDALILFLFMDHLPKMYIQFETEPLGNEVITSREAFHLFLWAVCSSYMAGNVLPACEGQWPGMAMALTEKLFLEKLACLFLMKKFQKVKLQVSCFGRVIYVWKNLDKGKNIYKSKVTLAEKEISSENMVVISYLTDWCETDVDWVEKGAENFLEDLWWSYNLTCLPSSLSLLMRLVRIASRESTYVNIACFPVSPCSWLCLASNQEETEYL